MFLSALCFIACFTAQIGAGTASSWGHYQPQLPAELKR
ncbi:MAG: cyclic lactone autoinducer peptide [Lachnospiraceae bacterium]|nr:cyclic lactone autoinducer peptide [Lachnospiraceae bacterium]